MFVLKKLKERIVPKTAQSLYICEKHSNRSATMHTLTIQNISDDFLEPFLALAKAVKANVITEKEDDDEN